MMQTRLILETAPRPKDSIVIAESWQDVEPILERNAMLRSMPQKSDWGKGQIWRSTWDLGQNTACEV
jgi:hypothetical protein